MESLLYFFEKHHLLLMSIITLLLWYFKLFENNRRSYIGLLLLPIIHRKSIAYLSYYSSMYPCLISYIFIWACVSIIIFPTSPTVYLIQAGCIICVEFYITIAYGLRLKNRLLSLIIFLAISCFLCVGIVKSIIALSYQPLVEYDFYLQILTVVFCIYILGSIIILNRFFEEIIAFFVFFGILIYSVLQVLATIVISIDIFKHFNFAAYATLFLFIFWIISVPWIRYLKSKNM